MKYYMHLIDGKPAHFDGEQICFNRTGRYGTRTSHPLARDLEQIKTEQLATKAWRIRKGFRIHSDDYGYCTVDAP